MSRFLGSRRRRNNDRLPQPDDAHGTSSRSGSPDTVQETNAHISSSVYAEKCRRLMQLHKRLSDLGAGTILNFPRIAVIGGQSAGKSSLVEAVSGIHVPRDAGTCTRCPMECSMHSAEEWSCEISLRTEYDSSGNKLESPSVRPFCRLADRQEVELWLRRAQAAILCPHMDPEDLKNKSQTALREISRTEEQMLKFSKNVVCLDLYDPEATDLSFIDLPGLIQNETQATIQLVRELVEHYVSQESTLILVTIPMSDDIENQQAVQLAKAADPDGDRTIGVLTKPDTLTVGMTSARQRWKEILLGQTHHLKHGYYCVLLPDDEERTRNPSRQQAAQRASNWFNSTSPWNDPMIDRRRFGIPGFISDISQLLVHMIENSLPGLWQQTNKLIRECEERLSQLPPRPDKEPATEVLLRVTDFCRELRDTVDGIRNKKFVQDNRELYTKYKKDVRKTAPNFHPVETPNYSRPISWDEEGDHVEPTGNAVNLYDVHKIIKESISWELPRHIPYEATKVLIMKFIQLWHDPTLSCFEQVFSLLTLFMNRILESYFGQFKQLKNHVESLTHEMLSECKNQTTRTLNMVLEFEEFPIYTQNTHYLEVAERKWLQLYSYGVFPTVSETREATASRYKDELEVMAKVRAYFQVSYKRIIDYVPLAIEHELNKNMASNIQKKLFDSFSNQLISPDRMQELLREDPEIAESREQLEARLARLMDIKHSLEDFGGGLNVLLHSDHDDGESNNSLQLVDG